MRSQQDWLTHMKGCLGCHQTGNLATRELAENNVEGWRARIKTARPPGHLELGNLGQCYAGRMGANFELFGKERALEMFAACSGGIAKGNVPVEAPPRPSGIERNVVLTLWDWGPRSFIHDHVSTDLELAKQDALRVTNDFKEGVKATAERRIPRIFPGSDASPVLSTSPATS